MDRCDSPQTAVNLAKTALLELFPNSGIQRVKVEEIEDRRDSEDSWVVTLGYWEKDDRPDEESEGSDDESSSSESSSGSWSAFLSPFRRRFKEFRIRASDGRVLSMKVRELEFLPQ